MQDEWKRGSRAQHSALRADDGCRIPSTVSSGVGRHPVLVRHHATDASNARLLYLRSGENKRWSTDALRTPLKRQPWCLDCVIPLYSMDRYFTQVAQLVSK